MQTPGDWIVLDENFPPGLVTAIPDSSLQAGQVPVGYGYSITSQGRLKTGSIPTGTTRVAKTYTISGNTWTWYYNRAWRTATNLLHFNAPRYTGFFYPQLNGVVELPDDGNSILAFFPIGTQSMVLLRSTGAHVIYNAADESGKFTLSGLIQEAKIASAANAVELDGVAYVSNTSGMFALKGDGTTEEISLPVRGTLTTAYALKADYENKIIALGSAWAYDVLYKKWFDYRTSGFLYQSRALQNPDSSPFVVKALAFDIDRDTTGEIPVDIRTKVGNRDWTEWKTAICYDEEGERDHLVHQLEERDTGRSFTVQIRTLNANLNIKRVYANVEGFTHDSRAL